jgi:hypothetical protein
MPVVGFLNNTAPEPNADFLHAFRQGLKESGYVEGENVVIEYRWAENQTDRLQAMAAGLVHRGGGRRDRRQRRPHRIAHRQGGDLDDAHRLRRR